MKEIKQYISEKLIVNNTIQGYNYHPKDKDELIDCIKKKIKQEGLGTKNHPLDLNDIDTSKITDMSELFDINDGELKHLSNNGYFNISEWNVSKVENMYYMFCNSAFNGDISRWDVSNVKNMSGMFELSGFNSNISDWDVSNVEDMSYMFYKTNFNGNISNWDVSNVNYMVGMFINCPLQNNPPKWYKTK